jgi:hypothetical protein
MLFAFRVLETDGTEVYWLVLVQRSIQALLARMGLPSRVLEGVGNGAQELILKREVVHADKGVRSR